VVTQVPTRSQIEKLCKKIGSDPLLVQGAGGNISWKENNTLWVKASGTWLCNASQENIFLPVDLVFIREAISQGNFDIKPRVNIETSLRPSIETLLHALIPQPVVLHLHAIDILCHLVNTEYRKIFRSRLPSNLNYEIVDYCKPGESLAKDVFQAVSSNEEAKVIFLLNHGLVISGESVEEVEDTLYFLINELKSNVLINEKSNSRAMDYSIAESLNHYGYVHSEFDCFNMLSTNSNLISIVKHKWALFPDHVVFLGAKALIGDINFIESYLQNNKEERPPFIFCENIGTFCLSTVSSAQKDQLKCFYDVAVRQRLISNIVVLNEQSIEELMDWDAEKYRIKLSLSLKE
jgi:rhamnose utilization protein RhaD (predicted bifunctional aldolase and dehydrogenase)